MKLKLLFLLVAALAITSRSESNQVKHQNLEPQGAHPENDIGPQNSSTSNEVEGSSTRFKNENNNSESSHPGFEFDLRLIAALKNSTNGFQNSLTDFESDQNERPTTGTIDPNYGLQALYTGDGNFRFSGTYYPFLWRMRSVDNVDLSVVRDNAEIQNSLRHKNSWIVEPLKVVPFLYDLRRVIWNVEIRIPANWQVDVLKPMIHQKQNNDSSIVFSICPTKEGYSYQFSNEGSDSVLKSQTHLAADATLPIIAYNKDGKIGFLFRAREIL